MSKWVVDASAILAFLNRETGQERVKEILSEGAVISTINQSEILGKLLDSGVPKAEIKSIFNYLDLKVVNFNEESAWETANLRSVTKALGLSLGDRACLSLAKQLQLPVVTADRIWVKLTIGIEIEVIR